MSQFTDAYMRHLTSINVARNIKELLISSDVSVLVLAFAERNMPREQLLYVKGN